MWLFKKKIFGSKFNLKYKTPRLSLVLIEVVLEVLINPNFIEPLEPSFFSVKKISSYEGNVYHRKLLERSLTVAVWRHGESVTTERMMINQPQPVMWNRDIHYALSSINYAADKQTHHIYCPTKNASWIIESETMSWASTTPQISDENYL